ncbi:hypothetical protein [Mesorhizobium sp. M8A.F.Ca.ET.021.01.1.1]|uniref:hypothetical protein n=1 Tax=Mesorhizobium sp. M8A.F.Ca.ET.021.01.1.1 TaxID=2496757 RepID=UPI000FCCCB4E|nr:hypothetical protein [Mesorhizobium sp. M8A.F.Ca.ET.021.01.1.1]RUW57026.1 hypothetical protein EOA36_01560 [Mesorhizobium sp. M8A.F.Ca.ET.021.01.1.1]
MSVVYPESQIRHFSEELAKLLDREDDLTIAFLTREFRKPETSELVRHGLVRRLFTLKHAIQRTFQILPPQETAPTGDMLMDATGHLQTFVINVFGAIDNLARIWCMEADIRKPNGTPLKPMAIGLTPGHVPVRASLSQPFQDYLANADAWFDYLEDYRHALAHRIPLYIPPRQLNDEERAEFERLEQDIAQAKNDYERYGVLRGQQQSLGIFNPLMMHSFSEQARPVYLHPQMLCDLSTVVEIGEHMLHEIDVLPLP